MNHQASSPSQGLFDTLARVWQLPAVAVGFCFSPQGRTVAVARADGALALAPLADPEPAESRLHVAADSGRATLQPRRLPPPPLITTAALFPSAACLIAHPAQGFIAAGQSGALFHIAENGTISPFSEEIGAPVLALSALPDGRVAVASPESLSLFSPEGTLLERIGGLPKEIGCMAPGARGHLAIGAGDQILLLSPGSGRPRIVLPGGPVSALRWRAGGAWLAAALGASGLALIDLAQGHATRFASFPTPVLSLDWSEPAQALLAAGAFRIAGWSWAGQDHPFRDSGTGALATGHTSLVPVDRVAAHPARPLAAASLINGQVLLAPIGKPEELAVKPIGGALTLLGWSPMGDLVIGDSGGGFALMSFPSRLFK